MTVIRLRRTENDTQYLYMQVDIAHTYTYPYQQCGNLMYFYINHVMYVHSSVYSYLWCILCTHKYSTYRELDYAPHALQIYAVQNQVFFVPGWTQLNTYTYNEKENIGTFLCILDERNVCWKTPNFVNITSTWNEICNQGVLQFWSECAPHTIVWIESFWRFLSCRWGVL